MRPDVGQPLRSNTVVAQAARPLYLIFLGAPGAGKGTQTAILCQALGIPRIASGDLFRENIKNQTELGRQAKAYKLVPDEVTVGMVIQRLAQPDCEGGAIFDGFPRTIPQAEALDAALANEGKAISGVVDLVVDHEILLERLSGRWMCRSCSTSYHLSFHPS
jgi:adenylate kinase